MTKSFNSQAALNSKAKPEVFIVSQLWGEVWGGRVPLCRRKFLTLTSVDLLNQY